MKRFVILLFLLLLCCISIASAEEILILPDDLTSIEDEAFAGDVSLGTVILPNGVTSIGERAFAESSLRSINLPNSVQKIALDAFTDCENISATVRSGSYAHTYCEENGIPYVIISEEALSSAEKYNAAFRDIETIVAPYEDSSGYVTEEERPQVLSAVGTYVEDLYKQGIVTDYYIGKTNVFFLMDGIECYYIPYLEGTMSGGNEVSFSVLTCRPEATKDPSVGKELKGVANKILSEFNIYEKSSYYENAAVDLSAIRSFTSDQVILWNSHGFYNEEDGKPRLITGMIPNDLQVTNPALFNYMQDSAKYIGDSYRAGLRYAISGDFIRNQCSGLDGSMIWLGACYSALDSTLPDAFRSVGAEAAVGFTDSVSKIYHDEIFTATMERMTEKDANGDYYTISEALAYAKEMYGSYDPYGAAHAAPKLFPAGSDYRLIERPTYTGTVWGKSEDANTEMKPISEAYLYFECLDDSSFDQKVYADENGNYQVKLYEGNYTVTVSEDNNILTSDSYKSDTFDVTVYGKDDHELSFVLNLIEGSVAGAFTDSFTTDVVEGVALSIADEDKEVVWTGSTDADGFYRAYLAPGSYTMSASKEGFESASYSFTIKADMQTTMNKMLQRITGTLRGKIFDHLKGYGVNQGVFEIHAINRDRIYCKTTDTVGNFTIDLAPGNYTIRFPEPFFSTNAYFTTDDSYSITIIAEQETYIECNPRCTHRYELWQGVSTFDKTSESTINSGAHIATISSAEENDLIRDFLLLNPSARTAHIGLTDQSCEGEWLWVNGEPVSYTNWSANEPNSENDETDYVLISEDDGTWIASKWASNYIREWDDPENTYVK